MNKTIFVTGVIFGASAILLGAFGAHGLERLITADDITTYETGVKYQMYHALLLLIVGGIDILKTAAKKTVYLLITLGVGFFSGSLYLLATNSLTSFDFKSIGFITPIGGILLVLGWLVFGYRLFKQIDQSKPGIGI